jgi:hypothetical protein
MEDEMDNPFAEVPDDPEIIVAQIRREAEEEWRAGHLALPDLDRCVREAVDMLWESEVRTFVPLLALRRVRSCIQAGTCNVTTWWEERL